MCEIDIFVHNTHMFTRKAMTNIAFHFTAHDEDGLNVWPRCAISMDNNARDLRDMCYHISVSL